MKLARTLSRWWCIWFVLLAWGCRSEGARASESLVLLPSDASAHARFWQTVSKSLWDENFFYISAKLVQGLGQVQNQTVCVNSIVCVGEVSVAGCEEDWE